MTQWEEEWESDDVRTWRRREESRHVEDIGVTVISALMTFPRSLTSISMTFTACVASFSMTFAASVESP